MSFSHKRGFAALQKVVQTMCFLWMLMVALSPARATIKIYPAPSGAPTDSSRFTVQVNDSDLSVYKFFNPIYFNWTDTPEPQFVQFDTDQSVQMSVTTGFDFDNYVVRPLSKNVGVTRSGRTLTFTMPTDCRQLAVEFDGDAKHPLLIFTNPPDPNAPTTSDSNRRIYFGPGVHRDVDLRWLAGSDYDNIVIYIAGGAVVYGNITVNSKNVTVRGSGIFVSSSTGGTPMEWRGNGGRIQDIVQVNLKDQWSVQVIGCNQFTADNFKILSQLRDGFDVINSQNVTLSNSFVMSLDDGICMKGQWYGNGQNVDSVNVTNCIVATMGGSNGLEIGWEADAPLIQNVTFDSIDLIYNLTNTPTDGSNISTGVISCHPNGKAKVRNITYKNIRVEDNQKPYLFDFRVLDAPDATGVDGLHIDNVRVVSGANKPSCIFGKSATADIQNVDFKDLYFGDTLITNAAQGQFSLNAFASNITFGAPAIPVVNLLSNPGFEVDGSDTQSPSGWYEASSKGPWGLGHGWVDNNGTHSGNYSYVQYGDTAYNMYTFQLKTGLANGLYTFRIWVSPITLGGNPNAQLIAQNFGGASLSASVAPTEGWTQMAIPNINVSNGQCEIGVLSNAAGYSGMRLDDAEFFKQ